MELIKIETKELANKELKKVLNTVNSLYENLKGNQKLIAYNLGTLINTEAWKDDFEKLSDFLRYIGLNKTTASFFKKFASCVDTNVISSEFSYTQIVETFPLLEDVETTAITIELLNYLEIKSEMSCKEIREIVKKVLESSVVVDVEEESEESEAETEEETEAEEIDESKQMMVDYLNSLTSGIELDDFDIKMLKSIAKELSK